ARPGAAFEAHAGLESVSLGATLYWTINKRWGFEAYAANQRLLGAAASSPVRETLSQFGGGIAILLQL
ncbi:MAG: MipA/OmpV family protein, partial [Stenotrophobium sp.]